MCKCFLKDLYRDIYKVSEPPRALSLVDSCVKMRVRRHSCDVLDYVKKFSTRRIFQRVRYVCFIIQNQDYRDALVDISRFVFKLRLHCRLKDWIKFEWI